eukprot:jgi/Tetstr1/453996/TSEL_040915.t1
MRALQLFLLRRVVYIAWLLAITRRALRIAVGEAEAFMGRPFRGLPTGIEMLDGAMPARAEIRTVVVWLRHPVRLLVGGMVRSSAARRMWLVRKISSLPCGSHISYVMHYWDQNGRRQSLLTRDPRRGLRPVHPKQRPCRSHVMAAYHGEEDVTATVMKISSSFHEEEAPPCPVAMDAYLRHRRGLSLRSHPVVITDATLRERCIALPDPQSA